jgi:diacylglycerol O-acyltransferase
MERLSGLDASFLYIETPTQPLNVCSILVLDTSTMPGGYTFDRLRDELALRIKAAPQFREKLADSLLNLDHPVWVEDRDFDIDRHLFRVDLAPAATHRDLAEICGHIASLPLDRSRPLWEMWVIEADADIDMHQGSRLAIMTKLHHSCVDGVIGANLLSQLCTAQPDMPSPVQADGPGDADLLQIAADGLLTFASRPLRLAKVVPMTAAAIATTLSRALAGSAMAPPFSAPPTRFNNSVTANRNVAFARLDLDEIKTVKNRFKVKVNDVVMAVCAGMLRRFLAERGELPVSPLVAMVPVSVHERSDRPGHNQVTGMFCSMHTHIDDPAERLLAIAHASSIAKEHSAAIGPTLLQDWTQVAARPVFATVMRLVANSPLARRPVYNLIVSDVAGPQTALYFLGCEVKAMYPFGPIFHGSALNVTAMSLNGELDVGITSCPDLLPDLWELADDITVALEELREYALTP